MTVVNEGAAFRKAILGNGPVSKASGTLTHGTTLACFTIAGGEVLVTGLWLVCTTAMAGANTLAVQHNPTTGDTQTIVTATDLGTADTAAGSPVGLTHGTTAAPAFLRGGTVRLDAIVSVGQIELVETGSGTIDGAVTVYVTWVPLVDGATLVAA